MFTDRSDNYDFKKLDQNARTQVMLKKQEQGKELTEAQKTLFTQPVKKAEQPKSLFSAPKSTDISDLPSSKYLQSFDKNMTIEQAQALVEEEPIVEVQQVQEIDDTEETLSSVDFDNLIEQASSVKIDEKLISKELNKATPAPKKNYSFRIKLVTGVYCILVALFGGWVIGNAIDIAHTNASLYETVVSNQELNAEIAKIVLKIKNFDNASKNPDDVGITTEIATEVIDTIPEDIIEPNEYVVQSNWFDILCNWLARIFGF